MSVIPESWKLDISGDATLEGFAISGEYKRFAHKVHWKDDARRFVADITLIDKDGRSMGISLPGTTCVHCSYDGKQIAWLKRPNGADHLSMAFRINGETWQATLEHFPSLHTFDKSLYLARNSTHE
ncbi:hypothetical protein C5Y93_07785 [Blastopirellula marina]|uniref:Uncharacterized protein n=2 Tax=Blastopirellula marina TaxID=124 RepID=A0A2S8GQL8_9BACT|nr:hypothetical protein C5Y93_07785 [Blastopirellula marina]